MTATVIDLEAVRAARRAEAIRRAVAAKHPCARNLQPADDDTKEPA